MKFTGLTISLALAGLGYSAAIPSLGNVEGTVAGVTGAATNIVGPVTSAAGGPTGAIKRDNTAAPGEIIKTIPNHANSAVSKAGNAIGTTQNAVAGAGLPAKRQLNDLPIGALGSAVPAIVQGASGALTGGGLPVKRQLNDLPIGALGSAVPAIVQGASGALTGGGLPVKRQLNDLPIGALGSAVPAIVQGASGALTGGGLPVKRQLNDLPIGALGSAVPAIVHGAKAGGLPAAFKRDGTAVLETTEPNPNFANSGVAIAGSAVGAGENLASGAASTAKNAASHT
ncbi:hypothetical protein N7447_000951 [Penicillium robsamsonii]|uniref:uncharacterized protein n=1 Tax=Penicillium robsamsonii TaxID=1792511 RepID=UPI002547F815|nr:uncharacterized protein N7447_000951 [Penicillium robsamsonii]KAJ5834925.1 hypothetical protein N7447_000951 [Penicillium robsamsonii]